MHLHEYFVLVMRFQRVDNNITNISFLAIIAPVASAVKVAGNDNGGTILLAFDDTQTPEVLKSVLLREQLLRVTIQVEDE